MDSISSTRSASPSSSRQIYAGEDMYTQKTKTEDAESPDDQTSSSAANSAQALTPEEQTAVNKLQQRDREVRQHEAAHLAAAGGLAISGARFSLETGPDGKRYAIGGDVRIDISAGRTPEETIRKARIIQAAALAPAEPSAPDLQIAAQARNMELAAQMEIARRDRQTQKVANRYQPDALPASTMASQA